MSSPSAARPPSPQPLEQRIAERYVVESEIARGGMGVVYKVRVLGSDTVLALKRIRLDMTAQRAVLQAAFEREYQVLASIDHPGIIRVFDYGVDGDQPYYTMEYVQGHDLRELAPLPWREACRQLRDVASALSLLHARRLVHRDLSPGNVKITPEGRSKLLDFGALSEFGYSKWVVGTPPLIAPEAFDGGMLDQRVDLYALGALAYWLMTGRHAYPATRLADLPMLWRRTPPAPSAFDPAIPATLDALVLSLLSANPLARPESAAEVMAHIGGIAELEPEPDAERQRLARSFLAAPPFVGRDAQVAQITKQLGEATKGRGVALRIHGHAGSGRSRLLEEAGVRAQIAGATVLRVDASMHAGPHGTSRALTLRLIEALPALARAHATTHRTALAVLGGDVLETLTLEEPVAPAKATSATPKEAELSDWFLAISREKPLVLQVDNAEYLDDVSLGLLAILAHAAPTHKLALMFVERSDLQREPALGMRTLRDLSTSLSLPNLSSAEMLEHVRSMFGDAPNVKRFAEWLFGQSAGSPLLSVELSRQLVEREVVRYQGGMWELPHTQPATAHSARIEEVLQSRIARLSPEALELARSLALQRIEATFALCVLIGAREDRAVRALLDELAHCDVMVAEQGAYRFSSIAVRELVLATMNDREREAGHLRLGRAQLQLAGSDPMLRIEAGWHLIRGGRELEGANLIARVSRHSVAVRRLNANMYRIGPPVEAALKVYRRHRRDPSAQLPLLSMLAQAGIFEDWTWDEKYSDEALDILDDLSGMRLARRLRFLGRHLALILAQLLAVVRFYLIPSHNRPFSFGQMLQQLFGTVLSSVAVAAIKLDGDRAERVAGILEPYSALRPTLTAPSIYRFCLGLQQIAREHQVEAFREFETFAQRLDDPRGFRLVPDDSRMLFVAGAHFARGAFAIFLDDGRAALESADVLTRSGMRLYAMIGSQLRFLYHTNRGEYALAAPHRAEVELHAAHFGSAWQVELWEAAALLPQQLAFEDVTAVTRLAHRLAEQARSIPSLRRYARLSAFAVLATRNEMIESVIARSEHEVVDEVPRSFIGWSATVAVLARAHNRLGHHEAARALCERALAVMTDDDRAYTTLFLGVDIEAAIADAKLGLVDAALARIDGLLARFHDSKNRLTLGSLHEARARITWEAGRIHEFEQSLAEVARWCGTSETRALVAKYERLVELQNPADTVPGAQLPANSNAVDPAEGLSDLETELLTTKT